MKAILVGLPAALYLVRQERIGNPAFVGMLDTDYRMQDKEI